ncbi:MAG: hypothetical protein A3F14_05880 [Gammaproteobacteria bacterium RIFCSPHIGHO2_12_FULL_43_28]|nr:MAG: hypothetical protein A3F14_05880 [Gammaproteobacteria bacterium RIFCSPHIGHO2_12_FULL_43_28]
MKNDDANEFPSVARLKWACRRGMLELDVLLGNFLNGAYTDLSYEDKSLFIRLLDCSDPELFTCLMGQEEPNDKTLLPIINKIRKHARS